MIGDLGVRLGCGGTSGVHMVLRWVGLDEAGV